MTTQELPGSDADLAARAADVLRENDLGGWTKAAPRLYPHQWSWDSAFISVGWAHIDTRRAYQELETLFRAQWSTGMVPHIVFNPAIPPGAYFPGPERWDCANLAVWRGRTFHRPLRGQRSTGAVRWTTTLLLPV